MTITHHLEFPTLMSYAAGTLPEPLAAVVSAHLAMCPECTAEVRRMERLGASLVSSLAGAPMLGPVPEAPRRESLTREAGASFVAGKSVPGPLQALIGKDLAGIPWRRLGLGVWHYRLPLSADAKGDLRLLKVAPGQVLPAHGHNGAELTLVLQGGYADEHANYDVGDISDLDETVEHQPTADAAEGCICLVGTESKARFKGLVARLVQPLTGM